MKKGQISLTILETGHVLDVLENLTELVKCEILINNCEISEHLRQGTHTEKNLTLGCHKMIFHAFLQIRK